VDNLSDAVVFSSKENPQKLKICKGSGMIHLWSTFRRGETLIANLRLEFKSICKRTSSLSTKKDRYRLVLHPPLTLVIIIPDYREVVLKRYQ